MASDRKHKQSNSIPVRFFDGDDPHAARDDWEMDEHASRVDKEADPEADQADPRVNDTGFGGPDLAELVASRAELKRLQTALDEAKEGLAPRQAGFENNRNEIEPSRTE